MRARAAGSPVRGNTWTQQRGAFCSRAKRRAAPIGAARGRPTNSTSTNTSDGTSDGTSTRPAITNNPAPAGNGQAQRGDDGQGGVELEGQVCLLADAGSEEDPCGYWIRPIGMEDLDHCQEIMHRIGFDTSSQDWSMIIRYSQDGVYGLFHGGQLVGLISAVPYPCLGNGSVVHQAPEKCHFGWLGNVVVHPDYRQKGIASMLLHHGTSYLTKIHQCRRVLLDASSMGKPVYNKLGFEDRALVHRMLATDRSAALLWASETSCTGSMGWDIACLEEISLGSILALDAESFGGHRGSVLEGWLEHIPGASFHATSAQGDCVGYSMTHSREACDYIGPVVAKDAHIAQELVQRSLRALLRLRPDRAVAVLLLGALPGERQLCGVALGVDWMGQLSANGFVCEETTTRQVRAVQDARGDHPGDLYITVACGSLDLG